MTGSACLQVQEVIDALETQIDSKLNDAVQGVRVVNGNCYVCLAKEDNAGALLETGLTLRGVKIHLEDVSRDTITVALSGVPHDVPDSTVARVVANYGTVIGESEQHTLRITLPISKEINLSYENTTQCSNFVSPFKLPNQRKDSYRCWYDLHDTWVLQNTLLFFSGTFA